MRIVLIFLAILLGAFAPPNPAINVLKYKVKQDGKDIGDVKATRVIQDGKVIYEVQTNINIKMLGTQKISYYSKATYQNGVLLNSVARSYLNNREHHSCFTTLKNNRYYEVKREDQTRTLQRVVKYSGSALYFSEPSGIQLVFSEMSGQDNLVRKAGEGHYLLSDAKSKKQNRYWYRGGILEKAAIKHSFVDLEIQRIN